MNFSNFLENVQNKGKRFLESEASNIKVELDLIKNSACNNCSSVESKIVELNQMNKKYEKDQIILENVLSIKDLQVINEDLDFPIWINLVQVKLSL